MKKLAVVLGSGCLLSGAVFLTGNSVLGEDAHGTSAKPFTMKLQPLVDNHTMAGAVVLLANKERILDFEAVGYADLGAKKPIRKDALFWIASMNKPLTRAAVMILADEGKVKLDDPVEKYLPEFKGQKATQTDGTVRLASHPFTIREAMYHMAGLPHWSKKEQALGHLDLLPLKEAVHSYAEEPLLWDPGTKYGYSNAGLNIVGRIVEVVSGMPYEQFMSERLLKPLGMNDTTFWPTGEQLDRLAKSYETNDAKNGLKEIPVSQLTYPLDDHAKRYPSPAGGLFSTAVDMAKFGQMALNGGSFGGKRILSEEAAKDDFSHGGAYKTELRVDKNQGLILVFLVQQGNSWAGDGDKTIFPMVLKAAEEIAKQSK